MLTHDLVQRGLSFDEAYGIADAVRDRIGQRGEIAASRVAELVAELAGDRLPRDGSGSPSDEPLQVVVSGVPQPFSRGLLARSIHAAGPDLDRAYRLVAELESELRDAGELQPAKEELARRVGDLLEHREGEEVGGRYRLVRSIQGLPRPLVIYLGGASGTGKSTLALDLAPLLRIYRINNTDTIRQVMRMVFSPAILPAIHRSSFEESAPDEVPFRDEAAAVSRDEERQRLIATFEEQATRICVGVRAVVERAVAENLSVVVEGVHLVPPLVPFADLEGAAYQLPLMLTTLDEETHRERFLDRGPQGLRRAERYLESFRAIRSIQQFLLQQAEHHDVPLIESTEREVTVQRAMRVVTGALQHRVPQLLLAPAGGRPRGPALLLVLDGMPDRPLRALGGRTPIQAAATPNLDRLAREGRTGLADPVAPGVVPDTASGSLAIFGQSPRAMNRGAVEALGAELELGPGDVALRANFATLDSAGNVVDRRAGRIREGAAELAQALDRLPVAGELLEEVTIRVRATTEHRLAIALCGEGLSSEIAGSDPGDGAPPGPPLVPRPLDPESSAAAHTARILALFEQGARELLADHPVNRQRVARGLPPANAVLTRGAGRVHRLLPIAAGSYPIRLACVSGDRTLLGLARWLGARAITSPAMTANLDTDLPAKFAAARRALDDYDLVVLHLKGADIAAHDRRSDRKVAYLEAVDRELGELLGDLPAEVRLAVASDHATLTELGQHAADPVPVVLWGAGVEADGVERFDETAVAAGALHRFPLQLLVGRLLEGATANAAC